MVAPKGAPSFIMGGIHNLRAATRHLDVATDPVASREARAATQLHVKEVPGSDEVGVRGDRTNNTYISDRDNRTSI